MYLYGASGHAKVILDIIRAQGGVVEGLVDDNPELEELCGIPVLHDSAKLSPFIVSIGNCKIRKMIAERLDCEFATAIHPSAIISSTAVIGEGYSGNARGCYSDGSADRQTLYYQYQSKY